MKTLLWSAVILSAAAVLPLQAANNSDGSKQSTFLGLVVAEQVGRSSPTAAENGSSTPCLVFDGGYIEGGDAIAGDREPTPAAVAAAVSAALQSRGFAATNGQPSAGPVDLVTYHWGVLRRRHWNDISLSNLNPNLKARLSLVARYDVVRDLEQYILADRSMRGASRAVLNQPTYVDARQYAEDPRYFIILTAYDFNDLKNLRTTPLWRVKMSALETSGSMADVVPALASASGPYLGANLPQPKSVRVTSGATATAQNQNGTPYAFSADAASGVDHRYVERLLKHEHTEFSGEDQTEWDEASWSRK